MKTLKLNIRTKVMMLVAVLFVSTLNMNSQQLAAAELIADLNFGMVGETTIETESEDNVNMEEWMNTTNWVIEPTPEMATEDIVIEDWMLESFEIAEEQQLELEEWMNTPFELEETIEEEMELENWMLDTKQW
jgi:hypothetical protein